MTINLVDMRRYAACPTDYITKVAGTRCDTNGECPRWLKFLERVTGGNLELQAYLARVAGYCLTGHTTEHKLFFLYGSGFNGKSVFTGTLQGIWGDYAVAAPMDMFVEARGERHPTELARLRGARLVIASETEKGRHLNESRIKLLTGGDKIAARVMRGDFFDFQPEFKLMFLGNHKPSLRSVDEAMRRRIDLIPFNVIIPPKERDIDLFEKLKEEWPAILGWAVRGCAEWRRIGLAPPKAVTDATAGILPGGG